MSEPREQGSEPQLKPCPFCGGTELKIEIEDHEFHVIHCYQCEISTAQSLDRDRAIQEWNQRPLEDAAAKLLDACEALSERISWRRSLMGKDDVLRQLKDQARRAIDQARENGIGGQGEP